MNLRKTWAVALATVAMQLAVATPSLSSDAVRLVDAANREAGRGERMRARADLSCLLMRHGLTIGMEGTGAMSHAVEHGVRVWEDRLPDCPFHFTSSSKPAITVRFVDEIGEGGDLQGQLHIHRYVRWGHETASYHVVGTIQVRDNADGRPLSSEEVSAVVEHELGHLLGLDDEEEPGVLMGPFVAGSPADGPSEAEVVTVERFRTDIRRALDSLSDRS